MHISLCLSHQKKREIISFFFFLKGRKQKSHFRCLPIKCLSIPHSLYTSQRHEEEEEEIETEICTTALCCSPLWYCIVARCLEICFFQRSLLFILHSSPRTGAFLPLSSLLLKSHLPHSRNSFFLIFYIIFILKILNIRFFSINLFFWGGIWMLV